MKYKINYTQKGTVYIYEKVLVEAESKEEAVEKLRTGDIIDSDWNHTEYDEDFDIISIDEIEEINDDN